MTSALRLLLENVQILRMNVGTTQSRGMFRCLGEALQQHTSLPSPAHATFGAERSRLVYTQQVFFRFGLTPPPPRRHREMRGKGTFMRTSRLDLRPLFSLTTTE